MNFLAGVNRVLRAEGILRGDDDAVASFTDTQHAATIELAQIAIQDELNALIALGYIPYEAAVGTITLVDGQRVYSLDSSFVKLRLREMYKLDSSGDAEGHSLLDYPGGEMNLARNVPAYRDNPGSPSRYYFVDGTTKDIGLYPVPNADVDMDQYRYFYQKSVAVTASGDTLPFVTEAEAQAFIRVASRRFRFLFLSSERRESVFPNGVDQDNVAESARSTLMGLLGARAPEEQYGRFYA